jgi:hypothetical protein
LALPVRRQPNSTFDLISENSVLHGQILIAKQEFLINRARTLERLGGRPKRFTDRQRIRLARKAKIIGRHRPGQITTIVTPILYSVGSTSA